VQLAAFFEGGVSYHGLRDMPLDEVSIINDEAKKIARERKKAHG